MLCDTRTKIYQQNAYACFPEDERGCPRNSSTIYTEELAFEQEKCIQDEREDDRMMQYRMRVRSDAVLMSVFSELDCK